MTVSIVIPNYNGEALLRRHLSQVIVAVGKQCREIIVVDDNSTDRSVQLVNSLINNKRIIKLIKNQKNLGFASTVNRGVRAAKAEIIVLLNTDVYPEKGFLAPLLPHFSDPKVFAVGMMDKSVEGDKVVLRGRGVAQWQRGFYVHQRGEIDQSDTAWVAAGSGAFRKSTFLQLGGFSEIYNPFYWEDIDLSYRAVQAGYRLVFEPQSAVVHEHEQGAIKQKYSPRPVELIAYRNQFLFVWRNANLRQWLSHLFWLPYHLIFTTIKSRGLFLLAFFWAIEHWFFHEKD